MICEDPEDDDIVPARRQQAEPENDCKIHLDVCNHLLYSCASSTVMGGSCDVLFCCPVFLHVDAACCTVCCLELLDMRTECEMRVQLINNIITSNKQCTLERMHKLLNLMGRHRIPKYDKTEDELLEYLDVLVDKGHLRCEGSAYSFTKTPPAE